MNEGKGKTMFSEIVAIGSWFGIALFMWSVSDSLAKIAAAMQPSSARVPTEHII
ncbi:MAG TPA: hypothetical protein VGM05_09640 [Planctomycetaceae bacterium]|jgi:hypothetical protein